MACAKPSDCAPCSKCPDSPAPVLPRCDVALLDGVYANATIYVDNGCIVLVQQGQPLLYQPDVNCAGATGGEGTGGGLQGEQGPAGQAATIQIGTVTSLAPGSTPTVTNVGTPTAAILNIGIPRGADGDDGAPPGGATSSEGGIQLQQGAIQTPLPVSWPPVLEIVPNAVEGAGVSWSFTKDPTNGVIQAGLDITGLITWFENELSTLADQHIAQQATIDDLVARVAALEATP